jgi:hypothetical protein
MKTFKDLREGTSVISELNVPQTLKFIKQAHGDQLYGKLPYWTHPRAVAMTGKKIFGARFNSDAVKVAFLHDVVEDTNVGLDQLRKMDFSAEVIEAVGLLTKDKSLTYFENINKIINSGNKLAMMVKYADNYENFHGDKSDWDPDRASSSQKKYLKSLNLLGDKLGVKKHLGEAASTSIGKPDEQTGTMSWEDFSKHVGKSKAFLIAKHPQFQEHISPEIGLGAKVAFRFKRVHGFEYVDAVHGPNKYVDKEKPGRRKWLHFHLSSSGKKVTQVDRYHNYDNKRHREGSLEWEHHDTWVHPTDKRESDKLAKRLAKSKTNENFQDGRNPQDRDDSARHGIPKGATIALLKKIRSSRESSPRKKQLAHWQINMRQGRSKD